MGIRIFSEHSKTAFAGFDVGACFVRGPSPRRSPYSASSVRRESGRRERFRAERIFRCGVSGGFGSGGRSDGDEPCTAWCGGKPPASPKRCRLFAPLPARSGRMKGAAGRIVSVRAGRDCASALSASRFRRAKRIGTGHCGGIREVGIVQAVFAERSRPAPRAGLLLCCNLGKSTVYLLILAHESLSVTVRLKTRCSGVESVSGQK